MVYFQCEYCIQTLKKKQVERHYMFECRSAQIFSCLTCFKNFDRDTIKAHISCVTEQEKYQKGDNMVKNKNGVKVNHHVKEVHSYDINELKWKGIRKTSKTILLGSEHHRLTMVELCKRLAKVYSNHKNTEESDVDIDLLKKQLMKKVEDDNKFVIDLSKNTIRFKS